MGSAAEAQTSNAGFEAVARSFTVRSIGGAAAQEECISARDRAGARGSIVAVVTAPLTARC